jgi:anthranilate synthase component 1
MHTPSKKGFLALAKPGHIIAVTREVVADLVTPLTAFLRLDRDPSSAAFLLESVEGGEKWGRFSFIGIQPKRLYRSKGQHFESHQNGQWQSSHCDNPLGRICELVTAYHAPQTDLPRFWGGLVGYLGYDMVRCIETLPNQAERDLPVWSSYLMEASIVVALDSLRQRATVICPVSLEEGLDPALAYEQATQQIDRVVNDLKVPVNPPRPLPDSAAFNDEPDSNFTREEFCRAVSRAREYIAAGDVIQVVLSQRFAIEARSISPFDLYRALRLSNPSPYMFYLRFPEYAVVGASPEILVRRENESVEVRPIAGTRRRGRTEEEDRAIEAELRSCPKEVAEHIMLLDLGRNDVGRIAQIGTVQVTEQMVVERYSHVMHLVSGVTGRLAPETSMEDIIKATFPAGTLSGAPKVRAMEIIEELEPHGRGVYGGAAGYLGYDGNLDLAIAIRSVLALDDMFYVQAGAGVVYDSSPEREFEETREKARGVLRAIKMAREAFDQ